MRAYTIAELTDMGDCYSADTDFSREFLMDIVDSVSEAIREGRFESEDSNDVAFEIADGCVPFRTHEVWTVFTDLGGYNEDVSDLEYEFDPNNKDGLAMTALFMIAERIVKAILDEETE